jgi:hypothetical protein
MTLLVVGNHQNIELDKIDWDVLEAVMLVHCVPGGIFDLKHRLQVHSRAHGIPLFVTFAIPPIEEIPPNIPDELLVGFGKTKSQEVVLYAECVNSYKSGDTQTGEIKDDSGGVPKDGYS